MTADPYHFVRAMRNLEENLMVNGWDEWSFMWFRLAREWGNELAEACDGLE